MKTKGEHAMSKYRTISGDMWDQIAYEQMGSSLYVDRLMKANTEHLDKFVFPAGVVLTIPEVKAEEAEDVPIWKRGMLSE